MISFKTNLASINYKFSYIQFTGNNVYEIEDNFPVLLEKFNKKWISTDLNHGLKTEIKITDFYVDLTIFPIDFGPTYVIVSEEEFKKYFEVIYAI